MGNRETPPSGRVAFTRSPDLSRPTIRGACSPFAGEFCSLLELFWDEAFPCHPLSAILGRYFTPNRRCREGIGPRNTRAVPENPNRQTWRVEDHPTYRKQRPAHIPNRQKPGVHKVEVGPLRPSLGTPQ
jgi:hypothetical protein